MIDLFKQVNTNNLARKMCSLLTWNLVQVLLLKSPNLKFKLQSNSLKPILPNLLYVIKIINGIIWFSVV